MFDRVRRGFRVRADYNRGLWPPVRYAHAAIDLALEPARPIGAWIFDHPRRRVWAAPLFLGLVLALVLLPFDPAVYRAIGSIPLGGDIRRELEAWQQFGALTSVVVVGLLVFALDPRRRARVADLALGWLLAGAATHALKLLIARPRPVYEQADVFLGPWASYPIVRHDAAVLATSGEAGWHLASMPSSHTSAAVALAVFIAVMYPRIRGLAWTLAGLVAFTRVWTGAHWPTDVVVGWTVGLAIAGVVVDRGWGSMLVEGVGRRGSPRVAGAVEGASLPPIQNEHGWPAGDRPHPASLPSSPAQADGTERAPAGVER